MITEEEFKRIMLYIISDKDGHTLTDTAAHFGTTRQNIRMYINRINDEKDPFYNPTLGEMVNDKILIALKKARSGAGKSSHRPRIISEEKAMELRYKNLYGGMSLRTLAEEEKCSFMTIANAINNIPVQMKMEQDDLASKVSVR